MTNFDYANLIQAAADPNATGGTVYNKGIAPTVDHFVVGGVATIFLPVPLWDSLTWPTRAHILSTFIETYNHSLPDFPADTLGFWIDGDYIHWDLGTVHFERSAAIAAATSRSEKAYYSTATGESIYV